MGKKKKKNQITTYTDNKPTERGYTLHTEAVEKLVTASEDTVPDITEDEIKKYKRDKLGKIPAWIKALFIKYWFNGAVYFFIIWGLGISVTNFENMTLIFVFAMGMITDLLVNNILRFFDQEGEYERWALINKRKFWTIFLNIIYAFILYYLVAVTYSGLNRAIIAIFELDSATVSVGGEPFLFALLYLLFDLLFIGLKHFIKKLIYDANKKLTTQDKEKQQSIAENDEQK